MMVRWHLSHWAGQLGDLHLPLIIPLKAAVQHLPLSWFKPFNMQNTSMLHQPAGLKSGLFLKHRNNSTYRPPSKEWTSHCRSWRRERAPCWQSHCRTRTLLTDHTGSPGNQVEVWCFILNVYEAVSLLNHWAFTSGRLCSLRWRLSFMKLVSHSFLSSTFFLLKAY